MNLGKYIFGIRDDYFSKVTEEEKNKQYFAYNVLALMFFILVFMALAAGICYGLVVFQSWISALVIGLFFSAITFILLLLVLFLNMTTQYSRLYEKMTDNTSVIEPHLNEDLTGLTDEEAVKITEEHKMQLRETNTTPDPAPFYYSNIFTSAIKVTLILIISCIVANGLELFIFHKKINTSLEMIRSDARLNELAAVSDSAARTDNLAIQAKWTLDMVREKPEEPFVMIDCYSILMVFDIMDFSMGKFKVVFDLLFAILFIIPFILVKKSRKYAGGLFLKEVALSDITTAYMFYLLAERKRQQTQKFIEEEYDYTRLLKADHE